MLERIEENWKRHKVSTISEQECNDLRLDYTASNLPYLSFSGGGFLGIYHMGVVSCMNDIAPYLTKAKCIGVSAGAMAASICALLPKISIEDCVTELLKNTCAAHAHPLGSFHISYRPAERVKDACLKVIPDEISKGDLKRIIVSVTTLFPFKNKMLQNLQNKKELVDAIGCSSFIPIFSGVDIPKFKNQYYIDGGITNNLPSIGTRTITISPIAGDALICPDEKASLLSLNLFNNTTSDISFSNLKRLVCALKAPSLNEMVRQLTSGYNNCYKYIIDHVLPMCSKHAQEYKVNSIFDFRQCRLCRDCRELCNTDTKNQKLPLHLQECVNNFCAKLNQSKYIYENYKLYRLTRYTVSLCFLPVAFSYSLIKRYISICPTVYSTVLSMLYDFWNLVQKLLNKLKTSPVRQQDVVSQLTIEINRLSHQYDEKLNTLYGFPLIATNTQAPPYAIPAFIKPNKGKKDMQTSDGLIMKSKKFLNITDTSIYQYSMFEYEEDQNDNINCKNNCNLYQKSSHINKNNSVMKRDNKFYDIQVHFLNSMQKLPYLELSQYGSMANVIHTSNQQNLLRKAYYEKITTTHTKIYALHDPKGPPPEENVLNFFVNYTFI